jgi:hypothetical protein
VRSGRTISPSRRELDTVLKGLEITKCMKLTFLRNSQPLSSVKTFPFIFAKAIFQYPAHNSKSLIAMLIHKNTVHIANIKAIFGNKCN